MALPLLPVCLSQLTGEEVDSGAISLTRYVREEVLRKMVSPEAVRSHARREYYKVRWIA